MSEEKEKNYIEMAQDLTEGYHRLLDRIEKLEQRIKTIDNNIRGVDLNKSIELICENLKQNKQEIAELKQFSITKDMKEWLQYMVKGGLVEQTAELLEQTRNDIMKIHNRSIKNREVLQDGFQDIVNFLRTEFKNDKTADKLVQQICKLEGEKENIFSHPNIEELKKGNLKWEREKLNEKDYTEDIKRLREMSEYWLKEEGKVLVAKEDLEFLIDKTKLLLSTDHRIDSYDIQLREIIKRYETE